KLTKGLSSRPLIRSILDTVSLSSCVSLRTKAMKRLPTFSSYRQGTLRRISSARRRSLRSNSRGMMNAPDMGPNDTFPQEIVKELEARGATPVPRWQFLVSRGMVWFLAGASVAIGGVAFAIAEFVFFDNDGITKLQGSSIQDIAQSI